MSPNVTVPSRTVLVTGATSGIGAATVDRFAEAGWNVVATGRRDALPHETRTHVRWVRLEVTDRTSIDTAVRKAADAFGQIDVLVNNAGCCLMGPLEANTMDQIRAQFETNVFGLIALTQAALPHLKETRGGIINIASVAAENGYPFNSVYSASKAAVMNLTEALNVELDAVGVFAKAVLPGFIATEIFTKLDGPEAMPRAYHPLWQQFQNMQSEVGGFPPGKVAETVVEAATDGDVARVRYHPTPDASVIPRSKRIMGHSRYWRTFRKALLDGPTWLQKRLAPQGREAVTVNAPRIGVTEEQ